MSRRESSRALSILLATAILPMMADAGDRGATVTKVRARASAPAPSAEQARPAAKSPVSFTPEMSFSEAIDILRNSTTPPLNLVVLWKEIGENAAVYRETPIGIDGLPGLRVRQYLDMLLTSLSAGAINPLSVRLIVKVVVERSPSASLMV